MEKRNQSIDGMINISMIVPLGPNEAEKLENKSLRKQIDAITKDLNVEWAVEQSSSQLCAIVSRMFGPVTGNKEEHDMEIAATNFMSAIEKLQIPGASKQDLIEFIDEHDEKDLEFAKKMLKDFDGEKSGIKTVGALVMGTIGDLPFVSNVGKISGRLLRKMFECYVNTHTNG